MTRRRTLLVLLTMITTCGISCGADMVEVLLECYSPDRKAVALVWSEVGG